ncbi:MAG: hypothetical protein CFE26_03260 [Verrucomicrobiales bacterium VVV1]|nr:MAG: hypothetical protein CFE26_03260 [Verrucomicrobiales bacterium VVV1]
MKGRVKRITGTLGVIFLLLVAALYLFMANEGYPTLAGVRNIFNRDGQIRIELPSGYSVTDVHFDGDGPCSTSITGNVATIRVGYTRATIDLGFATEGRKGHVLFGDVPKLNNWNRILFRAVAERNGQLSFHIDENGVSRDPGSYAINQATDQAAAGNGGQAR